jgi:hypothetical protein
LKSFASVSELGDKLQTSAENFNSKLVLDILNSLPNLDELVEGVKELFTVDNGQGLCFTIPLHVS